MKTDWIKKIVVCVLCVALAGSNIQMMNIQAASLAGKQAITSTEKVKGTETKKDSKVTETAKTVKSTEPTKQVQNIDNAKGAQIDSAALTSAGQILGASSSPSITNTVDTVDTKNLINIDMFNYTGQKNSSADVSNTISKTGGLKFFYTAPTSGDFNSYTGGHDVFPGIVQSTLNNNGYPMLQLGTIKDKNLDYLFNNTITSKAVTDINRGLDYLFTKDNDGYYEFNSDINRAVLDKNNKRFLLTSWASNGSITNRDLNRQYGSGFFPYEASNTGNNDSMASYGMHISFDFMQPYGGQIKDQDMKFTFSGDDDVWVFIDGVLALDLGGIHQAASGSIDFKTGVISQWDPSNMKVVSSSNLYNQFSTAKYPKLASAFQDVVDNGSVIGKTFTDYSKHHIEFFYLERGGDASNCHIKFNLPAIASKQLMVTKDVTAVSKGTVVDQNKKFNFQLYTGSDASSCTAYSGKTYEIYNNSTDTGNKGTTDSNGGFTLTKGQSAVFDGVPEDTFYMVREINPGNEFNVYLNGNAISSKQDSKGNIYYESSPVRLGAQGQALFRNEYKKVDFNVQANKTAQLINWDNRTYNITLSARQITSTPDLYRVTVIDYIDNRFDVDEQSVNQTGGTVQTDPNNGMKYVEWDNVNLAYASQTSYSWTKNITVKAKDSFIGGNDITTNGSASGVILVDNSTVKFAQPVVNVKVRFNANDGQDTIFKGTTVAVNYDATKNGMDLQNKLFDSNHVSYQSVAFNSAWYGTNTFVNTWYQQADASATGAVGLTVNGTVQYGVKTDLSKVLSSGTEAVYYLKTIYNVPNASTVATNNSNGNKVTTDNAYAISTYAVHVVDGELTITKKFDQEYLSNMAFSSNQKNLVDAKQSVVVTIAQYAPEDTKCTGPVKETYHAVLTYDATNGSYTGTAKVKGLAVGNYKVSEDTKWSWKYILAATSDTYGDTKDGIVCIGKKVSDGFLGQTGLTSTDSKYAAVTFTNKLDITKKWFSDTCNAVNSFINKTL